MRIYKTDDEEKLRLFMQAETWRRNGLITEPQFREIEVSTRRENQVNRLTELFRTGKGNNGRDRSDVFGAVTDYYSHESAGGLENPWKQFESSEFGSGFTFKDRAFATLQSDDETDRLIKVGDLVLAGS